MTTPQTPFIPVWITLNQTLGIIREGEPVSVNLEIEEVLTVGGRAGQFSLVIGGYAGRQQVFRVNGIETPYSLVGTQIQFAALTANATLRLSAFPIVTFSIVAGRLPQGLTLNAATGDITGIVTEPLGSRVAFDFVVRATTAGGFTERAFSFITPEKFVPVWITPLGVLASVTEGEVVSIPLVAEELFRTQILESQFFVVVGPQAADVTRVLIDEVSVPFTIVDDTVRFPAPSQRADLQVFSSPTLIYTMINGVLPPGLSMNSSTGLITGQVGNIIGNQPYEFTVRIENEGQVRDRTFIINGISVAQAATFNLTSLPPTQRDEDLDLVFRQIATLRLGESFVFRFDIIDPESVVPPLVFRRQENLLDEEGVIPALPPGIVLNGYQLQGAIRFNAPAGRYFFRLRLDDPIFSQELLFMIEVLDDVDETASTLPEITWITPSGTLGSIAEGEVSTFAINASVTGEHALTYGPAPFSGPLPGGLAIDATTGLIYGQARFVTGDTTYPFTVRASSGGTFLDRSFSITVRSIYTKSNIAEVTMRALVSQGEPLVRPYADIIPPAMLFRPEDPAFGLRHDAEMYILDGLDGDGDFPAALEGDGSPYVGPTKDYHGTLRLVIGSHRRAVARNASGIVLYEVIYRVLYDPQARAGGFQLNRDVPVEEKVLYPQDLDPHYVYPVSLRNIRYDLARDIGFPVRDPALVSTLGPNGGEAMPLWMKSEQVLGDPSSIIGFIPCVVLAFVKPGLGGAALQAISRNIASVVPNGRVYYFDKYYAQSQLLLNVLELDGGGTLFDVSTTFDGEDNSGSY